MSRAFSIGLRAVPEGVAGSPDTPRIYSGSSPLVLAGIESLAIGRLCEFLGRAHAVSVVTVLRPIGIARRRGSAPHKREREHDERRDRSDDATGVHAILFGIEGPEVHPASLPRSTQRRCSRETATSTSSTNSRSSSSVWTWSARVASPLRSRLATP